MSDWISVKDRLPNNKQMVIGFTPCDGFMFVGYCNQYDRCGEECVDWRIITAMRSTKCMTKTVTYWMPLPEGPEVR